MSVTLLSRAAASDRMPTGPIRFLTRITFLKRRVGCKNDCESCCSGVIDHLVDQLQLLCAGLELRDRVAHSLHLVTSRQRRLVASVSLDALLAASTRLVWHATRALCGRSLAARCRRAAPLRRPWALPSHSRPARLRLPARSSAACSPLAPPSAAPALRPRLGRLRQQALRSSVRAAAPVRRRRGLARHARRRRWPRQPTRPPAAFDAFAAAAMAAACFDLGMMQGETRRETRPARGPAASSRAVPARASRWRTRSAPQRAGRCSSWRSVVSARGSR